MNPCFPLFRILSGKDGRVKEISLWDYNYSKFFNTISFGRRRFKYYPLIEARTSVEFAEKFAPYIIKEITDENSQLKSIMYKIFEVPKDIEEDTLRRIKNKKEKLGKIKEDYNKLESTAVSDF